MSELAATCAQPTPSACSAAGADALTSATLVLDSTPSVSHTVCSSCCRRLPCWHCNGACNMVTHLSGLWVSRARSSACLSMTPGQCYMQAGESPPELASRCRGGQRWLGYLSTTSVYGDHGGSLVSEQYEARLLWQCCIGMRVGCCLISYTCMSSTPMLHMRCLPPPVSEGYPCMHEYVCLACPIDGSSNSSAQGLLNQPFAAGPHFWHRTQEARAGWLLNKPGWTCMHSMDCLSMFSGLQVQPA